MIDIESEVYTRIATGLRTCFPGITVEGYYSKAPSSFPFVSIVEADNYPTPTHLDSSESERYATLMFEVNVYSNRTSTKKSECRAIVTFIDEVMYSLNFTRLMLAPIPNMDNATIYRMTARYRAESDGTKIFRR